MSQAGSQNASIHSREDLPPYTTRSSQSDFTKDFEVKVNQEMGYSGTPDTETLIIPPTATSPGYAEESVLVRGLQVPAKSSYVTSGFKYPSVLARAGVTKQSWTSFTNEIKHHADLSATQWMTTIGGAMGALVVGNMMVGFFGLVPSAIVGHKMRKKREHLNFIEASRSGALMQCVQRWNEVYFKPRRLVVRVDVPGESEDMASMDVSTSKEFQQRAASVNVASSAASGGGRSVNSGYSDEQVEEGRIRMKAARRGRIVIIPLDARNSRSSSPPDSEQRARLSEEAETGDTPESGREVDNGDVSMFRLDA